MKRLFTFLAFVLFLITIWGQDIPEETPKEKKGYIGISFGAAVPLGEFSSTDINNDYSGFAKTGLSIQLVNFGYRFGKYIGVAGLWTGAAFNLDEVALRNNADLGTVNMDIDPWSFGAFMGGLLISIPSHIVDVDFRGMIGFGYGMAPEMRFSGYDLNGYYHVITQESSDAYAIAYDLGVGVRFNISRLISLNLFMDYMGCKPEFSLGIYSDGVYQGSTDFEQPMNHMTITGGIGFRL